MSPRPTDSMGELEKVVDERVAVAGATLKRLLRDKYPRSYRSERVPRAQQIEEYRVMREDPQILAQFFKDQKASAETAVKYVSDMEREISR